MTPQELEGASPTTCIVAPIEGGAPIANVSNLWSAGTDGRAPEPITDFATGSIFAIDTAKDGKTLYFLYGNQSNDIVLLKNFR